MESIDWPAAVVAHADDAIIGKNLAGIIQFWNPAAESLFGWTAAETIGQHISMISSAAQSTESEIITDWFDCNQRLMQCEVSRVHRDGTELCVLQSNSPICDRQGVVVGEVSIAHGVNSNDPSSDGVRHDFNNSLTAINIYSHLLSKSLGSDAMSQKLFKDVIKAIERLAEITRQQMEPGSRATPTATNLSQIDVNSGNGHLHPPPDGQQSD
ncbi:MAG: PAS domain-containing protein [Planctomycetota bacterium]|nr:PAS domain-containing protein [Planctomycetota bacterium]